MGINGIMSEEKQKRQILVKEITVGSPSRTIASEFKFGSWTFPETLITVALDPPIDLATSEGIEEYKRIKESLRKGCSKMLKDDIEYERNKNPELDSSIKKREQLVNNNLEGENIGY